VEGAKEELVFCYQCPGLFRATVTYTNDGRILRKAVGLVAESDLRLVQAQSDVLGYAGPATRGGEGQPVFMEDRFFTGVEYPVAMNEVVGGRIVLRQTPYAALKKGDSFLLAPVVYGFSAPGQAERAFLRYVSDYRPVRFATAPAIYNEWAAHDELGSGPELDEGLVHAQLDCLEKIWSGLSWDLRPLVGNRNVVFHNGSDAALRLEWQALAQ
jgi:hypothetical protein